MKWIPHANKFLREKCCRKLLDWRFFQLALKKRFARVFAWRYQENVSQNFMYFSVVWNKDWKRFWLMSWKPASTTQKLVLAMFLKLFPLGEVLGFLARNFQLLSAKKVVNIHVTIVQPEKCFRISKSLEIFLSFYRKLFPLAISNSTITVNKSKFGKSFSWKINTKSNKICCSNKSYQFAFSKPIFNFQKNV